jgi:hypothetical protein
MHLRPAPTAATAATTTSGPSSGRRIAIGIAAAVVVGPSR